MFQSSLIIVTVVGVLLVVAALAWRSVHRAQTRTRIAEALDHHDPHRRRAGVLVATEQGLRAHADLLADHLDEEDDQVVLDTLAEGVLRNSWEPADQPSILRLRLWAHERHTPIAALSGTGPDLGTAAAFDDGPRTQIMPAIRAAAGPAAPPLATAPPSEPARRGGRGVARRAGSDPEPTPVIDDEPSPELPRSRREPGRSRRLRSDPISSMAERRSRRAEARRMAAIAAVTPVSDADPIDDPTFDERPFDEVALVPAPRRELGRSRRARLESPTAGHDDVPAQRPLPRVRSNRTVDEPQHTRRRRSQPAPAVVPEPAPRRGARHRAEPGQLRFVRSDT